MINIDVKGAEPVKVKLKEEKPLKIEVAETGLVTEEYKGAYSIEPTKEGGRLETKGKTLKDDIVIEPIPSYYGRIFWDGSAITIV